MYVWECITCKMRVQSAQDFHINERLICVQCNAEMEPVKPLDEAYEYCITENGRKQYANPPEGDGWEEVHEKFYRGDFSELRTWRRKRV